MNKYAPFAKMNGLGNDIFVADMRGDIPSITPRAITVLACDPATKFDQIMAICDPKTLGTDHYIEIINRDGTRAQTCGNGMRCVVWVLGKEMKRNIFTFETLAGILTAKKHANGLISVDMGKPRFEWYEIPLSREFSDTSAVELQINFSDEPMLHSPSVVSMGNPHAIFWVERDVGSYELDIFGPLLEYHPIFPERANISIAQVTAKDALILRTWERSVGLTSACGSAACAAVVCAVRTQRTNRIVTVTLPGGQLHIEWCDNDQVMMTGPVEWEFSGSLDPLTGEWWRDDTIWSSQ